MDFKEATEELMSAPTRAQIAKAIGKSEATVRQAKLPEGNAARRSPPEGWERPLAALAKKEANRLQRLAETLQRQSGK